MSRMDDLERDTPGWQWLGYRTWRCAGRGFDSESCPRPLADQVYRVTGCRRVEVVYAMGAGRP